MLMQLKKNEYILIAICIHFFKKFYFLRFIPLASLGRNDIDLLCLSTFNTTPIALIKTNREVDPAEINGRGNPVGGIEPVTTAMFSIV